MRNERLVRAFDSIAAGEETKSRVWEKACQKQQKNRTGRNLAFSLFAAAAVFCLIFFGSPLLRTDKEDDLFTITAYALSEGEDGSIRLAEADMVDDRPAYWGGLIDNEEKTIYVGLDFKCEGADLASVEVFTDSGFFAQQYVGDPFRQDADQADLLFVGPEGHLVLAGPEFERIGAALNFDRESLDDHLFFWGTTYEVPDGEDSAFYAPQFPEELRFRAKATLIDGETVEQDIIIDLSGISSIVSYATPEEIAAEEQRMAEHQQLMDLIPMEECVLDEAHTQHGLTFGDSFEYPGAGPEYNWVFTINEETPRLLESFGGALRISAYLPTDGSDGHYVTLNNDGDGTFSVIIHIVPGEVIMRYYDGGDAYQGTVYTQSEAMEEVELSDIGITLFLPGDWKGRYGVDPPGKSYYDFYSVYSTEVREAFSRESGREDAGGVLFFIKKWGQPLSRAEWQDPSGQWNYAQNRYIKATEDGTYLLYYASDVQYTPETEDEYRQMYDEIDRVFFW